LRYVNDDPSRAEMTGLGMSWRMNVTYKGFEAVWLEIGWEKELGGIPSFRAS
jgi:hypothetical protein